MSAEGGPEIKIDLIPEESRESSSSKKVSINSAPSFLEHETDKAEEMTKLLEELENLSFPLELLTRGLSDLGPAPVQGLALVYRKLALPNNNLTDISGLKSYPYIMNLDLEGNSISDISVLSNLKYVVQIDLANNKLGDNLSINPPPYNLQILDLSRNQITKIDDLSHHRFLSKLCLDRNLLKDISPLANCKHLTHLSCIKNGISSLNALRYLPLKTLDLSWNRLTSINGIETLVNLEKLYLAHNSIETLEALSDHPQIDTIDLESNQIKSLREVETLNSIGFLRSLTLRRCPVAISNGPIWMPQRSDFLITPNSTYPPSYRLRIIFMIQKLTNLDSFPVVAEEKVAAINTYDPPPEVVENMQRILAQKRSCRILAKVTEKRDSLTSQKLRPIVIYGPTGSGKRTLTRRLLKDYPHIFGVSVSHTTRKPRFGEENGVHYHFVTMDEMNQMNEKGKFISCVSLLGHKYATSYESIEQVTDEKKICLLDLEFEGVASIRESGLNARFILVTTPSIAVLRNRLDKRSPVTPETLKYKADFSGINLADEDASEWLEKAKKEAADFVSKFKFDFAVENNDLDQAYNELRNYCLSVCLDDLEGTDEGAAD